MESENSSNKSNINPVIAMMQKRDRERKLVNEKNQRERIKKSEFEGVDYFESMFDTKVREIEESLNKIQPSTDSIQLQDDFNLISKELQDLQRYFTGSTIFLSDRKIQRCQDVINQLLVKSEETKAKLLPKKKFGFKGKSAKPTSIIAAAAAVVEKAEPKVEVLRKEFLWTESGKSNQVIEFSANDVNDKDLTFKEMNNCVIVINGHAGSLQMLKMKNCLILSGPVARSVFAESCENCTLAFSCQQLRLHSSTMCHLYIRVTSRGIIEDCKDIHFAPNTYSYENIEEDVIKSGLDACTNNWEDIGDFNWLSTDKPSPNWSRIEENERITDWNKFLSEFKILHQIS